MIQMSSSYFLLCWAFVKWNGFFKKTPNYKWFWIIKIEFLIKISWRVIQIYTLNLHCSGSIQWLFWGLDETCYTKTCISCPMDGLQAVLFHFGSDYSSMLLVLMSVEKCFAVYFPLKSKTVCTVKTAKWATENVGRLYFYVFFIIKTGIIESSGSDTCVYTVDMSGVLYIIDSIIYSFGPFTFMFITNFAIVFKFIGAKC